MSSPASHPERAETRRLLKVGKYFDLRQPIADVYGELRLVPGRTPEIYWLRHHDGTIYAPTRSRAWQFFWVLQRRWPDVGLEVPVRVDRDLWTAARAALEAGSGEVYATDREWLLEGVDGLYLGLVTDIDNQDPSIEVWRVPLRGAPEAVYLDSVEERTWFWRFERAHCASAPSEHWDRDGI